MFDAELSWELERDINNTEYEQLCIIQKPIELDQLIGYKKFVL